MRYAILFLVFCSVIYSSREAEDTLKLVHVFIRHGARTPELKDVYPSDPYKLGNFQPMGWGQLTNYGKQQAYTLGKNLRRKYGQFLGELYTPEIIYAQSTDFDRTKMSAILALAGLFPPSPIQKWDDKLNWQPTPIAYDKDYMDYTLRRPNAYCPVYMKELDRVLQSEKVKEFLKKKVKLLEYLREHSGKPMNKLSDVFSIFQTLTAENTMNLTLPEWTKSVYPHPIAEIAVKQCELENSNRILKKLNGGRSLSIVVNNMIAKSMNTLLPFGRKMFLYSGHENNIVNLLAAMNLYEPHFPGYSSALLIEQHYLRDKKQFAVKVLYSKNLKEEPQELQIEGCDVMCPLNKFIQILKPHIPMDYTAECEAKVSLN